MEPPRVAHPQRSSCPEPATAEGAPPAPALQRSAVGTDSPRRADRRLGHLRGGSMREPPPPTLRLAPRNGAGVAALAIGLAALTLVLTVMLFPIGGLLGVVALLLSGVLALRLDGSVSQRAGDLARLDRCLFTSGSSRAAADCAAGFARRVATKTGSGEAGGHPR